MTRVWIAVLFLAALPYAASIEQWREQREARLKADDGWLTVAGLFWLKEGENPLGSEPSAAVILPEGAPKQAGVFLFHGGKTEIRLRAGVRATIAGRPVLAAQLRPDTAGAPDVLVLGDVSLLVIQRGDRFGIRMRDKHSRMRREFTGLHWYPVKESYRVTAQWEPYSPPKPIAVLNILGQTEMEASPGVARFRLEGKEVTLEPTQEGDQLFFVFRDPTAGKETYPAGRFLYADLPRNGSVTLDFNKAFNPPCAFTPFATCPLPSKQNHLPVRIEAGELAYHHPE